MLTAWSGEGDATELARPASSPGVRRAPLVSVTINWVVFLGAGGGCSLGRNVRRRFRRDPELGLGPDDGCELWLPGCEELCVLWLPGCEDGCELWLPGCEGLCVLWLPG